MAAYELKYTAEEIDGILESIDEKTIYDDATQSEHGLMSVEDKTKLDGLPDGEELSEALDSKIGKRVPTTAGNLAKLTGEGNIADSGYRIDDFATEQQGRLADTAYQKPSSGIPKTDLASSVQTSLGKADTALQEHQDISGKQDTLVSGTNIKTVNGESLLGSGNIEIQGGGGSGEENVIESISVNGTAQTVTNKNVDITVPTKTSDLNNDSGFITGFTETDPTVPSWAKQSSKPSYDYSEISNTPTIPVVPTNVSAFTNDAGYLTSHQDLSNYIQKSQTAGLIKNDGTVDTTQYGTYSKPSGGIPASDLASGVIPTVPVQDVTVGGTSVVNNGTAVIPAIPDVSGKADKVLVATTEPSGGMLPNVLYQFGELSGNTTFTLATPSDNTIANHYYFTFDTPSTAPTITWPTGLTWFGGSAPTISASKHYEISVLNGIAIAMEV